MKISTRSRYGTRILLELARKAGGNPVQVSEIGRCQHIPVKYLEQLMRKLKTAGYVKSTRGVKGGHQLTQDPATITIGEIVRLFEGQIEPVECLGIDRQCSMAETCPVRSVWQEASAAFYARLDATTIADLMQAGG